uniref:K Homology domain-containing protein n=1 Tax=Romanomermis culicivorax TaxID=13658 RepID=A0A915HL02_ROMCU
MTSSCAGLPDDLPDEKSKNRLYSDARRRMKYEFALTRLNKHNLKKFKILQVTECLNHYKKKLICILVGIPLNNKDPKSAAVVIPVETLLDNRRRRRQRRSRPLETNGGAVIASRSQRTAIADAAAKGILKVNAIAKRTTVMESTSRKENAVMTRRDPARADSLPNSSELWNKNMANRSNSSQIGQLSVQSKPANATSRSCNVRTVVNSARMSAASFAAASSAPVPLLNFRSQADENIPAIRDSKRHPQKVYVSCHSIARVIGRGGNNINAIRESSGAHIEVEKQQKGQTDRMITIKGSVDATKQAILMINGLINDPDVPVQEIVAKVKSKDSKALEFYGRSSANLSFRHLHDGCSKNESSTKAASSSSKLLDSLWLSKDDIKIHCSTADATVWVNKSNGKSTVSKNGNTSAMPTYSTASSTGIR